MGKAVALLVFIGAALLLRAFMFSNPTMGLIGGVILVIGIALLVAELRKI